MKPPQNVKTRTDRLRPPDLFDFDSVLDSLFELVDTGTVIVREYSSLGSRGLGLVGFDSATAFKKK
jgi:hypothetical protein